jgi:squalene-hopene/tetraprenyl-beta-curcumene cyclase
MEQKMLRAEERMFAFLEKSQQKNGSWLPLWFGNQSMPDDANPYYGTAKVLLALAETKREAPMTHNGLRYLIGS